LLLVSFKDSKPKLILMKSLPVFLFALILISGLYSCKTKPEKTENPVNAFLLSPSDFDTIIDGKKIELFTLQNPGGIVVQLTNYGATIASVITPDNDGKYADITLGYLDISGYLTDKMNLGCIVGPYANRIGKGLFSIDGVKYQLEKNDGQNSLHSGKNSFSKKVWTATQTDNTVTMVYEAPDMEAGFPGNIKATAVYTLTPDNKLELRISAVTDKKTVINLTNHAYFNLGGEGSGSIYGHQIQIIADAITPVDSTLIPTGEFMPVANTPFDLREPVLISTGIDKKENEQIAFGNGYDHNWVLNNKTGELALAVRLTDPVSKRFLELSTNQPGLQFYSGNFMNGTVTGKSGKVYNFRNAVAMEPQFFPDSPNKANFPSTILEPGKTYEHITVYAFGVTKE
jgi:aldose 1-epimerase